MGTCSKSTPYCHMGQPLVSNRPRGPHFGEVGWDNNEFENNTEDMSDDEEAPNKSHEDKLEKAGMWQDSRSPPRRLVFSPRATQVSCPRPSILGRLGKPLDITDRL
jgi:hypothetical protein